MVGSSWCSIGNNLCSRGYIGDEYRISVKSAIFKKLEEPKAIEATEIVREGISNEIMEGMKE